MAHHIIMFIPTTANVDTKTAAQNLEYTLNKKNIRATLFPELSLDTIENFMASNHEEDLLVTTTKQCEELAVNNEVILIPGIALTKPYAAELNFAIAISLGAALIFVAPLKENLDTALKQLKIVMNPYHYRYKQTILGFISNQNDIMASQIKEQHLDSLDLKIPFLGNLSDDLVFNCIQTFLNTPRIQHVTPAIFKFRLIEKACRANKKIVLPEGAEPRTIEAANICSARGIAQCILLEEKNKIYATCKEFNLKLHDQIKIIEPQSIIEKYVNPLYEARRAKGLTLEEAHKQLTDHVMLGTMMLHLNEVDGLVSGAIHTTANTIRPALQIIKTPPDVKLVSSIFFMCLQDQVAVFGDCAINPDPTAEELADIAIQSAKSAAAFGIEPKVAMLSYSTGNSGTGPSVDKVRTATELVKKLRPDLEVEGPIQYDAAVSEETAKIKAPNSKVAGHATVFVMPNLDVGNIVYKAVQRNTGIVCVGPMLQGLRKPVNDLSRGCSINDIVFTIAITAIQALGN